MNNEASHSDRFEELCAAYVLNALEADERREFEAMMQEAAPEQVETYQAFHSAANNLAMAVDPAVPSESVEQQLMERIGEDAAQSPENAAELEETKAKNGRSSTAFLMSIAASIVLLLVAVAFIVYSVTLHSHVHDQQAKITDQQAKITRLKSEVQKNRKMLSILSAKTVDLIILKGQKVHPAGYGKVIWDPQKQQALLQVSDLPAVPSNKDYQLWLIKNGKPISAGVFDVNKASKSSFFAIQQLVRANKKNANAFAITLEPKGGSPQPTGNMYLVGKI
jgi:anti-sigma-K factor RskA